MGAQQAHPGTDRYSMAELLAICMAWGLSGGKEQSGGGANSVIPLAAARLAQLTSAPNLWLSTEGAEASK